jgi:hypothetical protein
MKTYDIVRFRIRFPTWLHLHDFAQGERRRAFTDLGDSEWSCYGHTFEQFNKDDLFCYWKDKYHASVIEEVPPDEYIAHRKAKLEELQS